MKKTKIIALIAFSLLMFGLGCSDSLRGVFSTAFKTQWGINDIQLSTLVSASYVGNLLFLAVGGKLLDKFAYKPVLIAACGIWLAAALTSAFSPSFAVTTVSIALAMGASTLLNTAISIVSVQIFAGISAMMVNIFFFVQGIGTSGTQILAGNYATQFSAFQLINLILAILAVIVLVLFCAMRFPAKATPSQQHQQQAGAVQQKPPLTVWVFAVLMFGGYFVAEHGIMNWMLLYERDGLAVPSEKAAVYLSVFWALMTLGRIVFSPLANKLGAVKTIQIFGALACVAFTVGVVGGGATLALISASGLLLSVLYPMMVLSLRSLFPESMLASATGNIIAFGTIADIVFNWGFGRLTNAVGYRIGFLLLPIALLLFYISFTKLFRKNLSKAKNA